MEYLSEHQTRLELIDKQIAEAGWGKSETTKIEAYLDKVTEETDGFADYVLLDKHGKPLAVIEAKKPVVTNYLERTKPQNMLMQFRRKQVLILSFS